MCVLHSVERHCVCTAQCRELLSVYCVFFYETVITVMKLCTFLETVYTVMKLFSFHETLITVMELFLFL